MDCKICARGFLTASTFGMKARKRKALEAKNDKQTYRALPLHVQFYGSVGLFGLLPKITTREIANGFADGLRYYFTKSRTSFIYRGAIYYHAIV